MRKDRYISHFRFSKSQRNGIFFLLLFIIAFQCIYFFIDFSSDKIDVEKDELLAIQKYIDSVKQVKIEGSKPKIYPFNPNYIDDYKGYALGMSNEEIDRLLAFRENGKFVNSAKEFQQVTKVSDEFLVRMTPYFKFPDWVRANNAIVPKTSVDKEFAPFKKKDINKATASELKTINGIGDKLSERIIRYRELLGGFFLDEQLFEVYGLNNEVAREALQHFTVLSKPAVHKIDLNIASLKELASIVYIDHQLAKAIVMYRSKHNKIGSIEELTKIQGFPKEKIGKIQLYLRVE